MGTKAYKSCRMSFFVKVKMQFPVRDRFRCRAIENTVCTV